MKFVPRTAELQHFERGAINRLVAGRSSGSGHHAKLAPSTDYRVPSGFGTPFGPLALLFCYLQFENIDSVIYGRALSQSVYRDRGIERGSPLLTSNSEMDAPRVQRAFHINEVQGRLRRKVVALKGSDRLLRKTP
jgi:hypothetical protein